MPPKINVTARVSINYELQSVSHATIEAGVQDIELGTPEEVAKQLVYLEPSFDKAYAALKARLNVQIAKALKVREQQSQREQQQPPPLPAATGEGVAT